MMRKTIFAALAILIGSSLLYSCKEYVDDLSGLGKRVEALEDATLDYSDVNKAIETLRLIARNYGFITSIEQSEDGTYTIKLKGDFNGTGELTDSTIVLTSGTKGEEGSKLEDLLTVRQEGDMYYWVFLGEWLLDKDGNKIPVRGIDGVDGKDGKDGTNGKDADPSTGEYILPQVRVNAYGYWEISNDGGKTWKNTGCSADGANGKSDPVVLGVTVEPGRVIFTIKTSSGIVTFTVPRN